MKDDELKMLKRFADLKIKEKEISSELKVVKNEARDILLNNNLDVVEIESKGKIKLADSKRVYTYSQEVQDLDLKLKEMKKEEEQNGVATYTVSYHVRFN
jgi:hypothetical protein